MKGGFMHTLWSVFAGVLYTAGFLPYIRGILRGETRPAKASWIIWWVLDGITLAGMLVEGTVNGQIIAAFIGAGVISVMALRFGTPGWTTVDLFCLVGGAVGIALWWFYRQATLGIVTSVTVTFLASIPTFLSAWQDPKREDRTAWTLYFLSCIAALLAIPVWTLADAAQPVSFTATETVMMYLLWVRPTSESRKGG